MCGIFGVVGVPDAAYVIRKGLHGLQNRGQEASGIGTMFEDKSYVERFPGTVLNNFTDPVLAHLPGTLGIGHNRYATARGARSLRDAHPIVVETNTGPVMIAHNGNFPDYEEASGRYLKDESFATRGDTERFLKLVLRNRVGRGFFHGIQEAFMQIEGTCSAVVATSDRLLAICDPTSNRPIMWGKLNNGYVVSSESCALDDIGVYDWKPVKPGTVMQFTEGGQPSVRRIVAGPDTSLQYCVFEWIYFASLTSEVFGVSVATIRKKLGRMLAREYPAETDLVIPIPDSGNPFGRGYGEENPGGVLAPEVLIRKHNTGRTFIAPGQVNRERAVEDKFSFTTPEIRGRRVVLVDDSLVRGTTIRKLVRGFRERGAREVHVRIGSPEILFPCYYGINTPRREDLISTRLSKYELCSLIDADSLDFLSMEGLKNTIRECGVAVSDCCFACMDGSYFHHVH